VTPVVLCPDINDTPFRACFTVMAVGFNSPSCLFPFNVNPNTAKRSDLFTPLAPCSIFPCLLFTAIFRLKRVKMRIAAFRLRKVVFFGADSDTLGGRLEAGAMRHKRQRKCLACGKLFST